MGDTVREHDGLAMSSRNVYLSPEQRLVAPAVYRSLCALQQLHASGERSAETLREAAMEVSRLPGRRWRAGGMHRAHAMPPPGVTGPLHARGATVTCPLRQVLRAESSLSPEYVSLSSCVDGEEVEQLPQQGDDPVGTMAAVAVKLGSTRLIDNVVLK